MEQVPLKENFMEKYLSNNRNAFTNSCENCVLFEWGNEKDLKGIFQLCSGAYTWVNAAVKITEASLSLLCKALWDATFCDQAWFLQQYL